MGTEDAEEGSVGRAFGGERRRSRAPTCCTTNRGEQRRRVEASEGGDRIAQRASPSLPL
jgi:hypothetical protein